MDIDYTKVGEAANRASAYYDTAQRQTQQHRGYSCDLSIQNTIAIITAIELSTDRIVEKLDQLLDNRPKRSKRGVGRNSVKDAQ